jgi:hypothetical protein
MIRRNSIILFAVFIILLAGILYINQDSNLQVNLGMQTATATQQPKLITNFDLANIQSEEIHTTNGPDFKISPNEKGNLIANGKTPVVVDAIIQSTQALMELRGSSSMDPNTPMDKVGLNPPQTQLILTDKKGGQGTLLIGNLTATQSDYYVKWENNPITMVSKSQVESLLGFYKPETLLAITPTPEVSVTPTP